MTIKPKILISKCIEHGHCRYDGSMISSEFVKRLKGYIDFVTVCPEVTIGLPVPREAIRILYNDNEKRLVSSMTGIDSTEEMVEFAHAFAKGLVNQSITGAILKNRSPSCGIKDVKMYPSIGKVACSPVKTAGFFGSAVVESNPGLPVEDEGRLMNYDIREHFLTRVYTLSRFNEVKEKEKMSELVRFQSEHKYLLLAYHQTEQKILGQIVANHKQLKIDQVLIDYESHLKKALMKPLRKGKNTNMILHMFGYVSKDLSADEKAYFLDQLSLYNLNKKPLSAVMAVLYGWVIRFDVSYLKSQKIFEPYPIEILDVLDSGKGVV